jgi:alanine racemase
VRAGIALYGYGAPRDSGLRPAMTLKARVVQIRNVPAGTTVGYGMAYRTSSPTTIATVALGYGDGYDRAHSGRGRMLVRGQFAPVIGRVCMDLTMLDIGGISGVVVGEEAVAFGRQGDAELPADIVAGTIGSIPYEALTSLTARVQRVHRGARSPAMATTAA